MGSFIGGLLTGVIAAYIGYLALLFEADPSILQRFQAFNCAAAALVRESPPLACLPPRPLGAAPTGQPPAGWPPASPNPPALGPAK